LPAIAHEVTLSDDLLPCVLSKLRLCDLGAAAVCRKWSGCWQRLCPWTPNFHARLSECGLAKTVTLRTVTYEVVWLFDELSRREAALATWHRQYANAIRPIRERALDMLRCQRDGTPTLLGLVVVDVALGAWQGPARGQHHVNIGDLPQGLRQYVSNLRDWARPQIIQIAENPDADSEGDDAHMGIEELMAGREWLRAPTNRRGPAWYVPTGRARTANKAWPP
jgi:hypothetical protein